jgi:hypothetical protein
MEEGDMNVGLSILIYDTLAFNQTYFVSFTQRQ